MVAKATRIYRMRHTSYKRCDRVQRGIMNSTTFSSTTCADKDILSMWTTTTLSTNCQKDTHSSSRRSLEYTHAADKC